MRKDGFSNGKQAYSCGDCGGGRYVPDGAYRRPSAAVKEQGIELYLEGQHPERDWPGVGVQRAGGAGLGQKKGAGSLESFAGAW